MHVYLTGREDPNRKPPKRQCKACGSTEWHVTWRYELVPCQGQGREDSPHCGEELYEMMIDNLYANLVTRCLGCGIRRRLGELVGQRVQTGRDGTMILCAKCGLEHSGTELRRGWNGTKIGRR